MNKNDQKQLYRVSAVITGYNSGEYIRRAIESVLAQSRVVDEVIVVDDGSTDDTGAVVKGFGQKVRYIYQENAGASAARNAGIKAAKYEWIALLDGDDEWLGEKQEVQMGLLERNPELVWCSANFIRCQCGQDIRLEDSSRERAVELLGEKEYVDSFFSAYISHVYGWTGTMIIKKEAIDEAGMFQVGLPRMNDLDMWFRIAYRKAQIGFIAEPLAIYHMGVPGSIIKKHKDAQIVCDLMDQHLALAQQHGCLDEFRKCARGIFGHWIGILLRERDGKDVRRILREYSYLFPGHFKRTTYVKSIFPRTGLLYDRIKKSIKK